MWRTSTTGGRSTARSCPSIPVRCAAKTVNSGSVVRDAQLFLVRQHRGDVYLVGQINPGTTWNNHNGQWVISWPPRSWGARMAQIRGVEVRRTAGQAAGGIDRLGYRDLRILAPYEQELNKGWKKFDPGSFTIGWSTTPAGSAAGHH